MKKIFLLLGLLCSLSLGVFAFDGKAGASETKNEVLEERIEIYLEQQYRNQLKAEYDVDLYKEKANIEVEIKSFKNKSEKDLENIANEINDYIRENTEVTDLFITFEKESVFGEDKLLYSKTFR